MSVTIHEKAHDPARELYEYEVLGPNNVVVGMAQLRLKASKGPDMPKGFESNIYYEIKPEHRGKNYATDTLRAVIKVAQERGTNQVVATVNKSNLASIRVIEKCGGKLAEESVTTKGVSVLKYLITTN